MKIDPNELPVLFKKRTVIKPDENEPIRSCPKCMLAMKKINYACDSNIIIDRCIECGGVWTDKGELKAIGKFIKKDPRATEISKDILESLDRDKAWPVKTKNESDLTEFGVGMGIGVLLEFLAEIFFD